MTHSFPTRRSSDLQDGGAAGRAGCVRARGAGSRVYAGGAAGNGRQLAGAGGAAGDVRNGARLPAAHGPGYDRPGRSEEHTSELQSLMRISYAVFCLKKKKQQVIQRISYIEL